MFAPCLSSYVSPLPLKENEWGYINAVFELLSSFFSSTPFLFTPHLFHNKSPTLSKITREETSCRQQRSTDDPSTTTFPQKKTQESW
jgi:hypothetical protein